MALWKISRPDSFPSEWSCSNQDNWILGVSNPWLDCPSMGSKKCNLFSPSNTLKKIFLNIYQPGCTAILCVYIYFYPIRVWQRVPTTRMRFGKLQSMVLGPKFQKMEFSGNVFSSFASWWTTKRESPTVRPSCPPNDFNVWSKVPEISSFLPQDKQEDFTTTVLEGMETAKHQVRVAFDACHLVTRAPK